MDACTHWLAGAFTLTFQIVTDIVVGQRVQVHQLFK